MAKRQPVIPSKHFIATFMSSFSEDPVFNLLQNLTEEDDPNEVKIGFAAALSALRQQIYDAVIPGCNDELESDSVGFKIEKIFKQYCHIYSL